MKLILFICMVPILPILYFVLRNEAIPKKNIVLGVTLPYEARQHEDVTACLLAYKKWLGIATLALLIPAALIMLPQLKAGAALLFFMVWLLFAIALPYAPYVVYHNRIKALKHARGWYTETAGLTLVDTRAAAVEAKRLSPWLFAAPIAISLIPCIYELLYGDDGLWTALMCGVLALTVALFYGLYLLISRPRAETVGDDAAVNAALTRVRRYGWGKMWLLMCWLTGAFTIPLWLFIDNYLWLMISTGVYMVLILAAAMQTEFSVRRAQFRLTEQSGQGVYTDDDRYWPLGMFYYNPDDSRLNVNSRTGINMTVNLARPAAKVLMGFSALCLVAMPFLGLWFMAEEGTPIALTVTPTAITARHTDVCTIERTDILSVSLMQEIPEGTRRTNGMGLETLLKGKFRMPDAKDCYFLLNPTRPPFLRIETAEKVYVLGGAAAGDVEDAYAVLVSGG